MKILFDKNDVRQLEENENYEGKFVILRPDFLDTAYRTAEFQLFKAQSGFGCYPDKLGSKVYGYYVSDHDKGSTRREYILGVATDEAIAQWEHIYGKKAE
jgi:hypothetical protein